MGEREGQGTAFESLATPGSILFKPVALTPDETAIMREHCFHGYQLLHKFPFLSGADEIVYSHHEYIDGTGYPRGLKGEQIPLGARIVAVANALDSMTSDLPHRHAQSLGEARLEIRRWSRRQFEPQVVEAFLSMPEETWGKLRSAIEGKGEQNTQPVGPVSSRSTDLIQTPNSVGSVKINNELDSLTGLRTPRAFFSDFERLLNDPNHGFALLIADFDHFKQVNDQYGHAIGDEFLRELALLFIEHCDVLGGVPYRYGGSVFDVILPTGDSEAVTEFAESVRIAVESFRHRDVLITVSIGVGPGSKGRF